MPPQPTSAGHIDPALEPRRYIRVAAAVRSQIDDGTIKPGDRVAIGPLTREHRVARKTAASGLRLPEAAGRLKRYPAHGPGRRAPGKPAASGTGQLSQLR